MIKINGMVIEQNHFSDGTLLTKYKHDHNFPYAKIHWKYENDSELFTLICLVKHIRERFLIEEIDLIMPYLPHARQDRIKSSEDVFTLKYFCEIINSLNFVQVTIKDVHSNVALALLDRCNCITAEYYIEQAIEKLTETLSQNEDLMLFYPDEGAMKRYSEWTKMPYAFGIKKRNWETGEITGLDLAGEADNIAGRNVLIVDDICSKGGTFYHSAKRLKEAGAANIYLYVTHCESTIYEGELLKEDSLIKHIFTTNSLLTAPNEKITIVE